MVADLPEHVIRFTSRRPAVRRQEAGVSQVTDGAKYRGWVPRCRGWAHAGSNLGLQSQQTPAAAACSAAAARRPTMRSPDPDKKSTYLNKAEGGPWPGVSECRSDLRPSVRWRLNTLLALSNLDLVHLCLVVTQASLHYLPICNICLRLVCAGLCKSSYLHSLAGWVLTHVAASRGCDSDDLYSFVTG